MNPRRKKLRRLLQSVGIQRNNFDKTLNNMRNYDGWSYKDIVEYVNIKRDRKDDPEEKRRHMENFEMHVINLLKK